MGYVFQGDQYWRLADKGVAYPKSISRGWRGLPNNLDAGFTMKDTGETFFFKGEQCWKFKNNRLQSGYPKFISETFPGIPGNIDAAFVWGGNDKVYFFKDKQYWRFDRQQIPPTSDRYPKSISEWDLTAKLEGALQWRNGKTYFFTGGKYWRFNDNTLKIDTAEPSFPRKTNQWWFGCRRQESLEQDLEEWLAL